METIKDIRNPAYNWTVEGHKHLNAYLMALYPDESKELDEILKRGQGDEPFCTGIIPDEEIDRYYELTDFLKKSMEGSISRYFTPRRSQ